MFSGIVERIGRVERVERTPEGSARLAIRAGFGTPPPPGASVAVNGVCLTVESAHGDLIHATAVPETLRQTTLGRLSAGSRVNLERALRVGDEIGGHWVQGHVDAAARVASIGRTGSDVLLAVEIPGALRPYVAPKGSLAVDGVSLTVAAWEEPHATVALVPYTLEHTIASEYQEGGIVNLEVDILARYLERLMVSRGIVAPSRPAAADARRS
ncbi:MAG: riboflavin synthase [Candidatus Eisenbacteria bacterium]|uniref:Riboflavin synthase n=1 Tax=Eiseniibacteriota bacterium TaxID=2212470 RepID=A0A538T7S7_UNCEI|nr:MAG: riboflavin synthase [Candidatus Eisenbacteria bacterium]